MEMKELIEWLNARTKEYDEGHPSVSDKEWDDAYFRLVELEKESGISLPDSPTNRINYSTVDKLEKVIHSVPMLSLAKTKDSNEFFSYGGGTDFLISLKLDGLSLRLTYIDGELKRAETRGNGVEGNDVTHLMKAFKNVPKNIDYAGTYEIDGECIITYNDFENIKGEYKNPRNLAAGSMSCLNAADIKDRNLRFIAWRVITDTDEYMSARFDRAFGLGFTTVPYIINIDGNIDAIITELQNVAKDLSYPIDGLVGTYDDVKFGLQLGNTAHHPKHSLAYKFYDEEYETELLNIEWTMGRTGVLTPVAVYKDIDVDGSNCNRASLHNVSIMEELLHIPFKGQKIKIFKANAIIPQVSWAEDILDEDPLGIPDMCPICGGEAEVKESNDGVLNLYCINPACEGKISNRIDHYCSRDKGMDIRGLSLKTIEKLMDWGWLNSISDIYNLKEHKKEWASKPGFGEKSVNNILNAIEESKKCNWTAFVSAIGIKLIGRTVSKELGKLFKDYNEFREYVDNPLVWFTAYNGFGPEMDDALKNFDYTEADEIAKILEFEECAEVASNSLEGLVFVITGKLSRKRDEIKAEIENLGGKVTGSVSAKTNYLICNDKNSATGKSADAKRLGIPVITEEEYIQKFIK